MSDTSCFKEQNRDYFKSWAKYRTGKSMHIRGNKLVTGSTQSGKSYSELHDILAAADERRIAIVVLDPHRGSLAYNALQHLVARGHASRIIWDSLGDL
jgi:hypothetical protein